MSQEYLDVYVEMKLEGLFYVDGIVIYHWLPWTDAQIRVEIVTMVFCTANAAG